MHAKNRIVRNILLFIIALAVLSCSQGPSESDARQMLETYLKDSNRNPTGLQVISLEKTNGLAEVKDGAKCYKMWFQAEYVYTEDTWGAKKGEHAHRKDGLLEFVKTEKGWSLISADY